MLYKKSGWLQPVAQDCVRKEERKDCGQSTWESQPGQWRAQSRLPVRRIKQKWLSLSSVIDGEQPGEVWPWPERCGRSEVVGELKVQQLLAGRRLQQVLLKGGGSRAPLWLPPFTSGARHWPVSLHFANSFGVSFAGSSSSMQLLKVGIPQARPSLLTVYFFPGPFQLYLCHSKGDDSNLNSRLL